MTNEDTICAISTPHGVGGVAMVRVSGPAAIDAVNRIWKGKNLAAVTSHTAHLGTLIDDTDSSPGEPLDQGVAVVYRAPNSFTGEDVVELNVHGSVYVQERLLKVLMRHGCRLANAGEFTRRAFASGKLDLAQAEAVADVIASSTRTSHRIAISQMRGAYSDRLASLRDSLLELCTLLELELDFSEEDVEFASRGQLMSIATKTADEIDSLCSSFARGNAIKNGIPVAIIGRTNAGKSTLLNAILGEERAIVSDIHGTTRDFIEDTVNIDGALFRLTDTAGLRETSDYIESIGIEKAKDRARKASVVIWLTDATDAECVIPSQVDIIREIARENPDCKIIPAINKCDIAKDEVVGPIAAKIELFGKTEPQMCHTIKLCAKDGAGLDELLKAIPDAAGVNTISAGDILVTNARHYESLTNASISIARVIDALNAGLSGDLIAQDLRETIDHLSAITARVTSSEILQNIFSRFCIGK